MAKKRGQGRFLCWKCRGGMKKADLICKECRQTQAGAVKALLADLRKSFGGRVPPYAAPVGTTAAKVAGAPGFLGKSESARRESLISRMTGDPEAAVRAEFAAQQAARLASHNPAEREQARKAANPWIYKNWSA